MNETTTRGPGTPTEGSPLRSIPNEGSGGAATVQRAAELPPFDFDVAKLTDVGRARPHNEDYVDYYIPPDPRQLARKGAIYLVADGMGGHQAGEVASRGVVELVIGQYYSDTTHDVGTSLVRAFRLANQQIHEQAQSDPAKGGMGSTLVAAVILGRKVYVANVGDSRAYLINARGTTQITEDHSWVEEQVRAKLLTPEQARRHPQRNLVTRALGSKPDVQVDLFEGELNAGDILLLCTDGLTGRAEDHEIADIMQQHPPQEAVRLLVALANERGGNDNISVLIVKAQREAVTVAAPVLVPAKKKVRSTRKSFLVPALAGVAAVLVLVLGGLLGTGIIPLFGHTPTPQQTVTSVASPVATARTPLSPTVEATLLPTVTVTLSLSPTVTPTGTVSPTGTQPLTGPTAALSSTVVPSPTVTLVPSATLRTMPATPKPSKTPRPPTPTTTPTATPQPTASRQAPTLVSPAAEAELQGRVTFKWEYPQLELGVANAFQVLIWREGETAHNGAADFVTTYEQTIDLAGVPAVHGPGRYYWSVVVVRKSTGERVSDESVPRLFSYTGP